MSLEQYIYDLTKCNSLDQGMEYLAEQLRKQANKELGYSFPPVQAQKIAKLRKIQQIYEREIKKTAYLTPQNGGFIMCLRKSDSPSRKNLSCAHEIGHTYFFDLSCEIPKPIKFDKIENKRIEKLCTRFAGALVIPKTHFLSSWWRFEKNFSFRQLEKFCYEYNVSLEAIIRRAMHLRALRNPKRFILIFKEKTHYKTGLEKKFRINVAVLPARSKIFVPYNIGVEKLGLSDLITKCKNSSKEIDTVLKMKLEKRDPNSGHFKWNEISCSAKCRSYGKRYLLGLFEVI